MNESEILDKLQMQEIEKRFCQMSEKEKEKLKENILNSINFWENEVSGKEKVIKQFKKISNNKLGGYERFKSMMITEYYSNVKNNSGYFAREEYKKKRILSALKNGDMSYEDSIIAHSLTELGFMNSFFNEEDGGKVFNLSKEIINFIDNTHIKNEYIQGPYNQILIPLEGYFIDKIELIGIFFRNRIAIKSGKDLDSINKELLPNNMLEIITFCLDHNDGNPAWVYITVFEDVKQKRFIGEELQGEHESWCSKDIEKDIRNKSKNIVLNTLNLINHPEIEIRNISKKLLRENKKRKCLLGNPDNIEINLTGKLKKYIYDTKENNAKNWELGHRFWVRGHWVEFKSERYKNMKGKKTWILPYIKGKGELKSKEYYIGKKEQQWINEKKMVQLIQNIYPELNLETRNRTMLNGLEIDCYIPSLKIGFEYNGEQHYNHIKIFHKTKEDFKAQKERDIEKNKRAKEMGIKLITIKYDKVLSEELILDKLKEVKE